MTLFNRSRLDSQQTMTLDEEEYAQKGLVEPKYMGTIADQRDMNALGRVQVLRVCCSFFFPFALLTPPRGIFDLFLLSALDVP